MPTVIAVEDVRRSPRSALFEGGDEIPTSMFITRYTRGQGPDLHLHPYPELFFVEEGAATFTVGDDQLTVEAGHLVVVPAKTPHGFKNPGDELLRVVSVHPSPHVRQTDIT